MRNLETVQILDKFSIEFDIKDVIEKALNLFNHLWVSEQKTYLRNSDQNKKLKEDAYFPTATLYSLDILLRILLYYPDWVDNPNNRRIIDNTIELFKNTKEKLKHSELNEDKKEVNCFTYSKFFVIIANIINHSSEKSSDLYKKSLEALESYIDDYLGVVEKNEKNLHPFIIFHVVKALVELNDIDEISEDKKGKINSLISNFQAQTKRYSHDLIADYKISNSNPNPSNSLALGFCASILNLKSSENSKKYLLPALDICFQEQDQDGCWPQGRILNKDDSIDTNLMEFTTYEVSWVLCDLMVALEKERNPIIFTPEYDLLTQKIFNAGFYTLNSNQIVSFSNINIFGWCSNSHFKHEIIESWTSAYALHFLLSLVNLREFVERRLYLEDFTVQYPGEKGWPSWCVWDKYIESNEPDNQIKIFSYIKENIIQSILDDPRELPNSEKRNVSLVLFGPPGTQKTTIGKIIANKLNWPIVYLDPGVFIENGIEMIASQTNIIFRKLNKLNRVVLLFDEFDELIRARSTNISESTTINSLITATLLPKLDFLHNNNSLVFIICTNHIGNIDPAILRGGRIDHKIGVPPPDKVTRGKIIKEILLNNFQKLSTSQEKKRILLLDQVDTIANETGCFTRKDLLKLCQDLIIYLNNDILEKELLKIIRRQKEHISISPSDIDEFEKSRKIHSFPDQYNGLRS